VFADGQLIVSQPIQQRHGCDEYFAYDQSWLLCPLLRHGSAEALVLVPDSNGNVSAYANTVWEGSYADPALPTKVKLTFNKDSGTVTFLVSGETQKIDFGSFRIAEPEELSRMKELVPALPSVKYPLGESLVYDGALSLIDKKGSLAKVLPIYPDGGHLYWHPIGALKKKN